MHHPDLALFRRLLQQARPYWVHVIAIFLLGLLATPLGLLTPLPVKIVVDNVIGTRPLPAFLSRMLPISATRSPTGVLTNFFWIFGFAFSLICNVYRWGITMRRARRIPYTAYNTTLRPCSI